MIELNSIKKHYLNGAIKVPVLRGIDFKLDKGETVAFLGRSGAGKSTLMNILGLLDQPSSGSYVLDGCDMSLVTDDDEISKIRGLKIGIVFQKFFLLNQYNIQENVALPMEYQSVSEVERLSKAEYLLEEVGLSHRLAHRPNQLSGGERQRVAIARALANNPKLILADEPTGNLDSKSAAMILDLFDRLHEETKTTMVVITHDLDVASHFNRIVSLADGRIEEDSKSNL